MRQRLFAIDVLAPLDCGHRNDSVRVVRRGDDDGIDVLLLVEHLAIVGPLAGVRVLLEHATRITLVHVAQGDDILATALVEVPFPATAKPDARDVELLARRNTPRTTEHVSRHDRKRRHRRRPSHEAPARQSFFFSGIHLCHSLFTGSISSRRSSTGWQPQAKLGDGLHFAQTAIAKALGLDAATRHTPSS